MNISPVGIGLIRQSETLRLMPYPDPAGIPTVGWGHKILPTDPDFSAGITMAEALTLLAEDLTAPENAVNEQAPWANQNQFDALADFTFECGVGALAELLAHGQDQVPAQLPRWIYAKVKGVETKMPGMVTRRAAEVALFQTPC
jgi:lysozyme